MTAELNFAVRELHIDLLFLEEFYSSENFCKWFISNTIEDHSIGTLARVEHSVVETDRESDLEVAFDSPQGEVLFLIENKINAQFQPDQPENYKNRAKGYVRRGKCALAYTVIFAPESYLHPIRSAQKFDFYISLERVIEYFLTQIEMGDRATYKIEVLKRAIKKADVSSVAYHPKEIDNRMTLFWQKYREDLLQRIPELYMPEPESKGSGSTFIGLAQNVLPPGVVLYHKFVRGCVDLQFNSLGSNRDIWMNMCRDKTKLGMTVEKSGKSAIVISIKVSKISSIIFYDEVLAQAREGQDAALRLVNWFNEHSNLWATFKYSYPK